MDTKRDWLIRGRVSRQSSKHVKRQKKTGPASRWVGLIAAPAKRSRDSFQRGRLQGVWITHAEIGSDVRVGEHEVH
jgi:hypothetical protein